LIILLFTIWNLKNHNQGVALSEMNGEPKYVQSHYLIIRNQELPDIHAELLHQEEVMQGHSGD
jgi:hypothetical protein